MDPDALHALITNGGTGFASCHVLLDFAVAVMEAVAVGVNPDPVVQARGAPLAFLSVAIDPGSDSSTHRRLEATYI